MYYRSQIVVVAVFAVLVLIASFWIESESTHGNAVLSTKLAVRMPVRLNPMVELDGMSKEQIYALRQAAVASYPAFAPLSYAPSENIFGQITSGKPWWGILGLSYYGPGEKGAEGLSEESRFLGNPYLLVGLDGTFAIACGSRCSSPSETYPRPSELSWGPEAVAEVTYNVSSYWDDVKYRASVDTRDINLIAYNARDFGYKYLYVDSSLSKAVSWNGVAGEAALIRQYIHTGGSCGVKGGCNNMSPYQKELILTANRLPARAHVKLWKDRPSNVTQPADFDYIILLK